MASFEQRCSVTDEQQRHQAISATRRFVATVSRQQQQSLQQQHGCLYLQQCKQRKSFRVRASKTFAYNVCENSKRKKVEKEEEKANPNLMRLENICHKMRLIRIVAPHLAWLQVFAPLAFTYRGGWREQKGRGRDAKRRNGGE